MHLQRHPKFLFPGAFLWLCLFLVGSGLGAPGADAVDASGFDWRAFLAPFHSVTVHLPIGFVLLATMLDLYYLFQPSIQLRKAVTLSLIISAVSAVAVAGLGFLRASGGGYDQALLESHKEFGVTVAVLTCVIALIDMLAYRANGKGLFLRCLYRSLLIVNLGVLTIAGHQGGNLTHGSKYLVENAPVWAREWLGEIGMKDAALHDPEATEEAANGIYAEKIRPIFEKKCLQCHGHEKQKGGYRLDRKEDALLAGESEIPAIVPFRPMQSYLVELITLPADADEVMPPDGKERLTPEEILTLIDWIYVGAPFGDEGDVEDVVSSK